MSPTVFRDREYRAFFFSREEPRVHVHVSCPDGEAKFWLEPVIALADYTPGLSRRRLTEMQQLVEDKHDEIERAWKTHFGSSR
jgi:hypothetical protein